EHLLVTERTPNAREAGSHPHLARVEPLAVGHERVRSAVAAEVDRQVAAAPQAVVVVTGGAPRGLAEPLDHGLARHAEARPAETALGIAAQLLALRAGARLHARVRSAQAAEKPTTAGCGSAPTGGLLARAALHHGHGDHPATARNRDGRMRDRRPARAGGLVDEHGCVHLAERAREAVLLVQEALARRRRELSRTVAEEI